jgi:RNA polymerase sigma-32 factor
MKHSLAALSSTEVYAIAKDLDVKPEEVREMEIRMGGHDIPLLAQEDNEEDSFAPADWLSDETNEPTQRIQQNSRDWLHSEGIQYALTQLDSRSQRIIEARWLNEGEEKTLHQLAAEFSISAERIRQLEQKALIKLREVMSSMVE